MLSLAVLFPAPGWSQYNTGTLYSRTHDVNASRYLPSKLKLEKYRFQIGLNYYFWAGNNRLSYGQLNDLNQKEKLSYNHIRSMLSSLKDQNLLGLGEDFQVLGLAFKPGIFKGAPLNVSLSISERFGAGFLYSKNFAKLIFLGNAPFAGKSLELNPVNLNVNYSREYALGVAFPLLNASGGRKIRLGGRVKFLQGIAGIYMPGNKLSLYTQKDGRYIDLDVDYLIHTSGFRDFSLFHSNGSGWGFDAGITVAPVQRAELLIAVNDLGSLKYFRNTLRFSKDTSLRFKGLIINKFYGGSQDVASTDSLASLFVPDKARDYAYRIPLGARLIVQGRYELHKNRPGLQQMLFFTYVQGFQDLPASTRRPFFSLGYSNDVFSFLTLGVSAFTGGYNNFSLGGLVLFTFGNRVKLGIASDNFTPFINKDWGSGIDLSVNLSVGF